MDHVVYCDTKSNVLEKILNKEKTMIVRGAAGRKIPHSRVFKGDTLYFVENDGSRSIKVKANVTDVINTDKMDEETSIKMINDYADQLNLSKKQYERWAGKKVLCLVSFDSVEEIEPLVYDRRKNMDDWIIIEDINDILEGNDNEFKNIRL